MKGEVKWFNADKGFGFIYRIEGDSEDIFVHYTQILEEGYRSLEEGEEVKFDLCETERGLQAKNVVRVSIKNS